MVIVLTLAIQYETGMFRTTSGGVDEARSSGSMVYIKTAKLDFLLKVVISDDPVGPGGLTCLNCHVNSVLESAIGNEPAYRKGRSRKRALLPHLSFPVVLFWPELGQPFDEMPTFVCMPGVGTEDR